MIEMSSYAIVPKILSDCCTEMVGCKLYFQSYICKAKIPLRSCFADFFLLMAEICFHLCSFETHFGFSNTTQDRIIVFTNSE